MPRENIRSRSVYRRRRPRNRFSRRQPVAFFRRTVDTNSFLSIVRVASIAHRLVHTARPAGRQLVFFLLRLYTRVSILAHARELTGTRTWPRFRPINKSRPPRPTGYPVSRIIMKKRCYSILQLVDFLIPGNNRENISSPSCFASCFVPLSRRRPRCFATVYQLAKPRFSFYAFSYFKTVW